MHLPQTLGLVASLLIAPCLSLTNFDQWEHGRVALKDRTPLLLVHGSPQHSLTWRIMGPILAENFTAIAPDNRGAGDSSIPPDSDYSAAASAADLKGVLDFLNITETYVFSHDKGVGMAAALAAEHPSLVKRASFSEYILPGFGYEAASAPAPFWDLWANWQLAFCSVPDAAEFLIRGRETDVLSWWFYHCSYSGVESFSEETLNRYATSISKPGFLRGMLGPFSTQSVRADAALFKGTAEHPLDMPILMLGGEACFGAAAGQVLAGIAAKVEADVVPKAGHWIGE
ncbi:Alpha/Beta hydrolase protein [Cercophora newfieldiana]|uniref:Alpha/Beta hydrolase protein n=1 Tax=Cercophora newfieldiana TaxID=92897 RepID=A0AA39YBM4_9PEZI|nr:Alpha/Beta hydrolase protein [Cercophora newfieldiana]